ncbi:SMP-30/gluconolactonase/LRE family protein [Roseateles flavus]|uniref:SMP-30/gluconolactonase/LRE family protein n=1 Tax=Roseateles flavus TaxID=3149041 RepID=A0ABV0G8M2_9BURK
MSLSPDIRPVHPHAAGLGESPLWHAQEQALYWVDIPGKALLRLRADGETLDHWPLPSEPGCIAVRARGGLLMARRDGIHAFDPATGRSERLLSPPYDPARQRFNDGKADPQGRWWIGGIDDARAPEAFFYRLDAQGCQALIAGVSTGNGLAFSPDGRRLYCSDTKAHTVQVRDYDPATGLPGEPRVLARFAPREVGQPLSSYGGRPDGAAVDAEGAYWVAMFEGQRLLRLSPEGEVLAELPLPVRCPTMPAFGGPDLRTLFITTARQGRPAEEVADQPWAGCVLQLRVEVPGLPVPAVAL